MSLTPTQLQQLSAELTDDPLSIGYAAYINENNLTELHRLLAADDPAGSTARRTQIPMAEVYAQVDWITDYVALTNVERGAFRTITSTGVLDASSQNIVDAFEGLFGTQSSTWQNIAAIVTRPHSRAEAVVGTPVTIDDIQKALAQ